MPAPACDRNGILAATTASLVSAGTEKMIVDIAKKSLLGKAKARPDLVKQVIGKMQQEGVKNTLEKVFAKLDSPIPLGYSCAGEVIEVGDAVDGVSIDDRVACGGAGYANHAEVNYIPKNLCVKISDIVDDIDASFVTVGAIALQGVRQAEPNLGECIAVIGLGLIGQLTLQLLKANGCKVVGCDLKKSKLDLAQKNGADVVCKPDDLLDAANNFSKGYGVDSVIICASTSSNQPIIDAGEITRMRGKVVVVGMVGMDIPRNLYYKKELDVRLSMAYGPGRYDPNYEEKGIDYPYSYVRWTEQRNFEAFLDLVAADKVRPKELVTHQFDFDEALKAYELLEGKNKEKYLGIILKYRSTVNTDFSGFKNRTIILKETQSAFLGTQSISYGLIGAGNFTKSIILPTLKEISGYIPVMLCSATGVSAHAVGTKHGFFEITTKSDEVFNNDKINTVLITTRHNSHAEYVLKALKTGKHVFVEKPLCLTREELVEIKSAYSSLLTSNSSPVLMVGYNRRFSPLVQRMKELVGKMPMAINYRVNAGVIGKDIWIQDPEIGGGRILGEVCHFVDTCSFLAGSEPVRVQATCVRKDDRSVPDEDNVSILITYANGSTATIGYYAYGDRQLPKEFIEIFSGNMALQMNDFRELLVYKNGKKERQKNTIQDKGFKNEFAAFKDSLVSGKPAIPFESLINTSQVTFAILESLRTMKSINIGKSTLMGINVDLPLTGNRVSKEERDDN